jgi:CBS domain-containing protein
LLPGIEMKNAVEKGPDAAEFPMKARDVLQPRVVTVAESATVETAVRLMLQHHVSGLPVVDGRNQLVGIVTEGDFLRRAEIGTQPRHARWVAFLLGPGRLADEYRQTHTRQVRDVMTPRVVTVEEDTDAAQIVHLMERHRIKRVPVVRGKDLVGIISRADLVRAFGLSLRTAKLHPIRTTDADIRAAIVGEMGRQAWGAGTNANVMVRDGVVDLYGSILDERERQALRVMAENVPGVKRVGRPSGPDRCRHRHGLRSDGSPVTGGHARETAEPGSSSPTPTRRRSGPR